MNVYYFYRMTCDTGNAPCVFEKNYIPTNVLTLACCKGGQIRKGKPIKTGLRHTVGNAMKKSPENNYYITGILKDRIVYAARITQSIPMVEYFANIEYRNRMDCIYDVNTNKKDWKLTRRVNFNSLFHGAECTDQHHHDELGEYVLLSTDYIYQGNSTNIRIDASVAELMPKRQESKCYDDNDTNIEEIKAFVDRCMINGIKENYSPTEPLLPKNCKSKGCQK